ncbi:MAG: amino acid adenylation domain-containing protein [Terracidiphilus sp.]
MPAPESQLLHEWLRSTAAATPNAPAIVEENRVTSFDEIFDQAAKLAALFIENGLQTQDRIALVLPKNTDAIVAVFASLLAGAIYVPIHPRWPQERIDSVLAECDARLVIEEGRRIIDRQTGATLPRPATNPANLLNDLPDPPTFPSVNSEDIAFILFTSGSTGRPKGVALSHRAVAAFVRWTAEEFHITAADRLACPSPLGFDLSTFDLFNMALTGATAVLVPDNIVWMPRFLTQFVSEARISCWYSVPSILSGMLQDGRFSTHAYPDLRLILFAGEVFPSPILARLQAALPAARLVNLYGPTETNVVTWQEVPAVFDGVNPLPIGRSCPYAVVCIDESSGELLAGGDSLMQGYWNRPEETQRSFKLVQGQRFYHTGDRVSIAPDGSYLFLGRLDRQVKRRGFRIELGEIEAALARHEVILESAVVAVETNAKGVVITAFLRLSAEGAITLAEVKARCGRHLPPYMLPDRIHVLDTIPKGSRGKIDYLALCKIAEGLNCGD